MHLKGYQLNLSSAQTLLLAAFLLRLRTFRTSFHQGYPAQRGKSDQSQAWQKLPRRRLCMFSRPRTWRFQAKQSKRSPFRLDICLHTIALCFVLRPVYGLRTHVYRSVCAIFTWASVSPASPPSPPPPPDSAIIVARVLLVKVCTQKSPVQDTVDGIDREKTRRQTPFHSCRPVMYRRGVVLQTTAWG